MNPTPMTPRMIWTPTERALGRLMRAPEGHSGDGGAGGDGAPAGDAAAPAADAAAAADASADQVTSLAGGAGGDGKAPEGNGKAPEGDAAKPEGEGAEGEALVVLGAPEAYEVSAPEGVEFDKAAFDAVEPILREMDISNAAAQKLVGAYAEKIIPLVMERAQARSEEANVAYRKSLADEARADPEIGGAKFDQTLDRVATVWEQFGIKSGTGFRQLLDDSGIGNHPDMLRFLSRVGTAVGEGGFVRSDGNSAGERKSDAEVFYGAKT